LLIHGVVLSDAMNTQQTCYSLKFNMQYFKNQLFNHSNLSKKFTIVVAFHKPLKVQGNKQQNKPMLEIKSSLALKEK
jgi:hypothetical protein